MLPIPYFFSFRSTIFFNVSQQNEYSTLSPRVLTSRGRWPCTGHTVLPTSFRACARPCFTASFLMFFMNPSSPPGPQLMLIAHLIAEIEFRRTYAFYDGLVPTAELSSERPPY